MALLKGTQVKHPRLAALAGHGQSIWLDSIDRQLLGTGGLARLLDQGVSGVTTNPSIFQKSITAGNDYDDSIRGWLAVQPPQASTEALLESLMVDDVRAAADLLRDTWERSNGTDGFVSIEVSPLLAHETEATVGAAERLWAAVNRPNAMIKIPGTKAGLPAIEAVLAAGINVNVTLLFDLARYQRVLEAHCAGIARVQDPRRVASVASFFISRIDTKVDAALEALGTAPALALRGKIAVACAKRAWQQFRAHLAAPDFATQRARGAQPQRLLWASTGTKNPDYPDTLYVDTLIGPDTVNTLPPATLDALLDHGTAAATIGRGVDTAVHSLEALRSLGISLTDITAQLEEEGVDAFATSWRELLSALDDKRRRLAGA